MGLISKNSQMKKNWKKPCLFYAVLLCAVLGISLPAIAQQAPIPVIFETDMGNDIDDALALAMLYRYQQEGKIELLGVSNNKSSLNSVRYLDVINNWYGYPDVPIATVRGGEEGEAEANSFARKTMELRLNGRQAFYSKIDRYEDVQPAVSMYRELLSKRPDSSVTIISVGFLTNLKALLQSGPDRFSVLDGNALVAKKVSRLVVMGGNLKQPTEKEFNIRTDVAASQYVFDQWPTPVFISPFEVGEHLLFPAAPIERNLGYADVNPLVEGYKLYIPMPYDRPTWDLTAVLFAIEEDYFQLSRPGKMVVNADATTRFEFSGTGSHRYLQVPTLDEASNITEKYVELIYHSRKRDEKPDPKVFKDPPVDFRPLRILHSVPDTATVTELKWLGYGGLVTNVSYNGYLNDDEQWSAFRALVSKTIDSLNLRVWIYDEEGYPSGSAGGEVLKRNPGLEALGVSVIMEESRDGQEVVINLPHGHSQVLTATAVCKAENVQAVDLRPWIDRNGTLRWQPSSDEWQVYYFAVKPFYEQTHATNNWYARRRMVNLLEPQIGDAFVTSTHEKYRTHVGDYFGKGIEVLFTDEPAMVGTHFLENPPPVSPRTVDPIDSLVPIHPTLNWSRGLLSEFRNRRGYDLLPEIYRLVGVWTPRSAKVRVDYYKTLNELVTEYYFKPLEQFGAKNNIASSGHLLLEEDLFYHPIFQGNIQQVYRHMQHPGIDLLTAHPDVAKNWGVTTAKLASSVANQCNRPHVMSEISNAFDSEYPGIVDIEGVVAAVGVQYAFGVDQFASYYGHKNFSESENRVFTDYIGRVGYMLSNGRRRPLVDVFYPIESMYSLTEVPLSLSGAYFNDEALAISNNFKAIGLRLVENHLDFDYVDMARVMQVGASARPLIIPFLKVLDNDLLAKIAWLVKQGVPVAFQQKKVWAIGKDSPEAVEMDLAAYFENERDVLFADDPEQLIEWIGNHIEPPYCLDGQAGDIVSLYKTGVEQGTYLFVNTSSEVREFRVDIGLGGTARLWDPVNGFVKTVRMRERGGRRSLSLQLKGKQSMILTADTN